MNSKENLMTLLEEAFYNGWLESTEEFNNEIHGYYEPEQAKEELKKRFNVWVKGKTHLNMFGFIDSLIGKRVIWKGKEYTIIDKHNISDFIIIDDENNSVIGLNWGDVELLD